MVNPRHQHCCSITLATHSFPGSVPEKTGAKTKLHKFTNTGLDATPFPITITTCIIIFPTCSENSHSSLVSQHTLPHQGQKQMFPSPPACKATHVPLDHCLPVTDQHTKGMSTYLGARLPIKSNAVYKYS